MVHLPHIPIQCDVPNAVVLTHKDLGTELEHRCICRLDIWDSDQSKMLQYSGDQEFQDNGVTSRPLVETDRVLSEYAQLPFCANKAIVDCKTCFTSEATVSFRSSGFRVYCVESGEFVNLVRFWPYQIALIGCN